MHDPSDEWGGATQVSPDHCHDIRSVDICILSTFADDLQGLRGTRKAQLEEGQLWERIGAAAESHDPSGTTANHETSCDPHVTGDIGPPRWSSPHGRL